MTAGSGVLCSLEGEANLPAVVLDPGLFVHALLNLARNAREAMGGTGRLTMRTRMGPGSVVVEVEDTGRGIAPEHVTRLFEPFFTTKMGAGGYGLGLEPVRELVHLHGGKIGVETTLGQGTRFVLSFPAVQTQRAAASGAGSISKG
jgi:signal transduction histidine kinase